MERGASRCVVPVEEVAFVRFEPLERRECVVQPTNQHGGRQVAEIVCRQRREQRHPDVGRGRPPRQTWRTALLVVVWREPRVLLGDKRLVVTPGLPRHAAERLPFSVTERPFAGPDRNAQPVGHSRRRDPQQQERQR
jgi:hypothetical protein